MSERLEPVRLERVADGVAIVVFDHREAGVNKLDRSALAALDAVLSRLETNPPSRGVLFLPAREQFSVGADVALIAAVSSREEALAGSRFGQDLFNRLAGLPVATVAAVAGPCLGGGLEWALACDRIIAASTAGTRLGLPEVRLGILPAWGGSQRLTRRIGLGPAVQVMAGGRNLAADEALKIGLVDRVVPFAALEAEGIRLIGELAARHGGRKPPPRTRRGPVGVLARLLPPIRSAVFARVRREVARRAGPHYPAPLAIVEAVETAVARPFPEGLARERELFADLVLGDVSRQLVGLFQLNQAAKGWYAEETGRAAGPGLARIAVLGAGVMGSAIALRAAENGIDVVLRDIAEPPLQAGMKRIRDAIAGRVERRRLTAAEGEAIAARVRPAVDLAALAGAGLVIEAVIEEMELKKRVLGEAARAAPGAILATNTSALSVAEMGRALPDPALFGGLHFFNPVDRMPLVEVVASPVSSPATMGALVRFARQLDKVPIKVADAPGFLVNRVLSAYLGEAALLAAQGTGIGSIDRLMRGFGMPMGPLELIDQVGLDVAAKVVATMRAAFPGRLPEVDLVGRLLAEGRTGEKGGAGFYRYQGTKEPDQPFIDRIAGLPAGPRRQAAADDVSRLIDPMIAEAARCLEEGVVAGADEVDLAMILGIGWPPFRGGLLRHADRTGLRQVVERLESRARQGEPRLAPPPALRARAESGGSFRAAR